MSIQKKLKIRGILMLLSFFAILIVIFLPLFKGQNGLDYMDSLFNSISKKTAYYVPELKEQSEKYRSKVVYVKIDTESNLHANQTAKLFETDGVEVTVSGSILKVHGDLGKILHNSLTDADAMYLNDGGKVSAKYDYEERQVMYNWWKAMKEMDKDLKRQKFFDEAQIVTTVNQKAVEMVYNYYGIEPKASKSIIISIVLSLVFYFCYTLWYGFGIMFLFEGLGLKTSP